MSTNLYEMLLLKKEEIDFVEPIDNSIIVRVDMPPKQTAGGILISDNTLKIEGAGRVIGRVIKVGPKVMFASVGERVFYAKYAGTVIYKEESGPNGGEDFEIRVMDETNIIAKIAEKKEA